MIDFEWYRSFVAIYQTGTVSAAAARLMMTQPGVSQHLAALERALETPLFKRAPRQMVPTVEGQTLYAQVVGAVEQLERLADPRVLRQAQQPLSIKIGAPREYFYALALPQIATLVAATYRLQATLGQTLALIRQLEAGDLDLVIATQPLSRKTIHYFPLQTETFVLIAPPDLHVQEGMARDKVAAFLEMQSWIAYGADLPIIRRYWQDVFRRRPLLTPSLLLPDLLMILRAVSLGMGVSVLPRYLCQEALHTGIVHIPWAPPVEPGNQLYLACLRDRIERPETQWVLNALHGK